MDNLLTYKLVKDLMTKTKQEAMVLKADFLKAYDRVQHMLAMGFDKKIIRLAQGLVE